MGGGSRRRDIIKIIVISPCMISRGASYDASMISSRAISSRAISMISRATSKTQGGLRRRRPLRQGRGRREGDGEAKRGQLVRLDGADRLLTSRHSQLWLECRQPGGRMALTGAQVPLQARESHVRLKCQVARAPPRVRYSPLSVGGRVWRAPRVGSVRDTPPYIYLTYAR